MGHASLCQNLGLTQNLFAGATVVVIGYAITRTASATEADARTTADLAGWNG